MPKARCRGLGLWALITVSGNEVFHCYFYRVRDIVYFGVRHSRVDRQSHPTRLGPGLPGAECIQYFIRLFLPDIQQQMTVRARATTATPGLDAEPVIEQPYDQIIMSIFHDEGGDPQAFSGRAGTS